jgi:hypothetical protein
MGMTLWAYVRNGPAVETDRNDCSWMYRLAAYLDGRCRELGVPALSSFFDHTDLAVGMGEGGDDEEEEPAHGVDDMSWFPAADGLRTLEALATRLAEIDPIPGLPAGRRGELFEELDGCIRLLRPAPEVGRASDLAVLM